MYLSQRGQRTRFIYRQSFIIKKQRTCKPGSVMLSYSIVCHQSRPYITAWLRPLEEPRNPPSGSGGQPSDAGIHELATSRMHSTCVTTGLVGSCPAFSPLPLCSGGYFLLHCPTVAGCFFMGSGLPCVARTFLRPRGTAADRPALMLQKYVILARHSVK